MNLAAQELGKLSATIRSQRIKEPILAVARSMIPEGKEIPAALNPELILCRADMVRR